MPSRRDLAAETWGALLRLHADLVPQLDRRLRNSAGLSLAWYDLLLELAHAPDHRLTMKALAERVVLSRSRVSRLVDELVAAELVSRTANPDDARSAYATLTAEGLRRFRRAAPAYVTAIEESFAASLSDSELRRLHALLTTVLAQQRDQRPVIAAKDARSSAT
jgi:DNA-binding MarR family transcriptional regulator